MIKTFRAKKSPVIIADEMTSAGRYHIRIFVNDSKVVVIVIIFVAHIDVPLVYF